MIPTHIIFLIEFWNNLKEQCLLLPDTEENAFAKDLINVEDKEATLVCLSDEEIEKIKV